MGGPPRRARSAGSLAGPIARHTHADPREGCAQRRQRCQLAGHDDAHDEPSLDKGSPCVRTARTAACTFKTRRPEVGCLWRFAPVAGARAHRLLECMHSRFCLNQLKLYIDDASESGWRWASSAHRLSIKWSADPFAFWWMMLRCRRQRVITHDSGAAWQSAFVSLRVTGECRFVFAVRRRLCTPTRHRGGLGPEPFDGLLLLASDQEKKTPSPSRLPLRAGTKWRPSHAVMVAKCKSAGWTFRRCSS